MRSVWDDREPLLREYAKLGLSLSDMARRFRANKRHVRQAILERDIPYQRFSQAGPNNPAWRGGLTVEKSRYILVYMPDHPQANRHGQIRQHRLVAEHNLGRPLVHGEVVHHRDGNPLNNDPANVAVFASNSDHLRHELTGKCPHWSDAGKHHLQLLLSRRDKAGRLLPIRDLLTATGDPPLTKRNPSRKSLGTNRPGPSGTESQPTQDRQA